VRGGTGGQGLANYNGIGGRGGDIYVVGEEKKTLKNVLQLFPSKRFSASKGEDSRCDTDYVHMLLLLLFLLFFLHPR